MISYNPKDWLIFVFRFHKADTVRKLFPLIVVMCLYAWLVVYLEQNYFKVSDLNYAKNVTMLHNLLGFAISMLLVFRTNTAYDRWWEGRKLWGQLVNNSRNLAVKMNSFLDQDDAKNRAFFQQIIPRFARAMKLHLRSEITRLELDEQPHPEIPNFDHNKHVPNQIAGLMMTRVNLLYRDKIISGDQMIILNNELKSFLDICGACERIKNTPIPYSYSGFIKKFIFFYIITLPIGLVASLGMITIPVVAFIFYVLASLEIIAQEIEEPFGKDTNDLPMERLYETINKNCKEILS